MNAEQYRAWISPLFGKKRRSSAETYFLSLPQELEAAAGPNHFLETAVSSERGLARLKLALILETPPAGLSLDSAARNNPKKASLARGILGKLRKRFGSRHDHAAADAVIEVLRRWKLLGSLMISIDFDRDAGTFDKASLYAYLPGGKALPELLEQVGMTALAPRLARFADRSLEFWALDLFPNGGFAIKFYNRTPYRASEIPVRLRPTAKRLERLGEVRDVTWLTRVFQARPGKNPILAANDKIYLGFRDGVALRELAEQSSSPFTDSRRRAFLRELSLHAPNQRAYFIGFTEREIELYFDRRTSAS